MQPMTAMATPGRWPVRAWICCVTSCRSKSVRPHEGHDTNSVLVLRMRLPCSMPNDSVRSVSRLCAGASTSTPSPRPSTRSAPACEPPLMTTSSLSYEAGNTRWWITGSVTPARAKASNTRRDACTRLTAGGVSSRHRTASEPASDASTASGSEPSTVTAQRAAPLANAIALYSAAELAAAGGKPALPEGAARIAAAVDGTESEAVLAALKAADPVMVLLGVKAGVSRVHASRRVFEALAAAGITAPVIHHLAFAATAVKDEVVITSGSEVGALLVDGLGDGVLIDAPSLPLDVVRTTSFGLLQGSRMRNTKTEFVSCPSCGRTLFDLQEVTQSIQKRTGHLPGVAIAVMGCIVNGPGEMADADFGYVGGAPGKIDLYVGKEVVKRAIPNDEACDELIQLIKDYGRWVDPPKEEEAVAA